MKRNILRGFVLVLILAFLGLSFTLIIPIEESDAWFVHWCTEYIIIGYDDNGDPIYAQVPLLITHLQFWDHGNPCPTPPSSS